MLVLSPVHGQQTAEQPGFQFKIEAAGEKGPHYTVVNLTGKPVTACVIELSSSSKENRGSKTIWDAVLQGQAPIEPGASLSQYLSHAVGGPLPDKVQVIAGVWTDGETFGQPDWISLIFKTREMRASAYEQAIAILKQGLDENWNSGQFLQAIAERPNSGPIYGIRSTLLANRQSGEKPQLLRSAMQRLLESFTQKAEEIRKAKPTPLSSSPL
jgi:hypothetical protein